MSCVHRRVNVADQDSDAGKAHREVERPPFVLLPSREDGPEASCGRMTRMLRPDGGVLGPSEISNEHE